MRRFVGKFIGTIIGFTLAGPMGAFLGLIIGHLSDVRSETRRETEIRYSKLELFPDYTMPREMKNLFAPNVIALGAKMAKCDGHVTRDEVLAFRRAFRTYDVHLDDVGRLFDKARTTSDGYEPYAARLAQIFGHRSEILEEVLAGLFFIAIADSPRLTRNEILFLKRVGVIFGFNESDFLRIAGRVGISMSSAPPEPKRDSAYDVLGLPTTATDDVIKRTYRALVRKHHPDKLLAAGLPAERVAEATERIKTINAAYAEICKMREIR